MHCETEMQQPKGFFFPAQYMHHSLHSTINRGYMTSWKAQIFFTREVAMTLPHGMCYSHYGNGVRNGAISIAQWGLLSDCYKVNPIGQ